jgi:hypothetical protein
MRYSATLGTCNGEKKSCPDQEIGRPLVWFQDGPTASTIRAVPLMNISRFHNERRGFERRLPGNLYSARVLSSRQQREVRLAAGWRSRAAKGQECCFPIFVSRQRLLGGTARTDNAITGAQSSSRNVFEAEESFLNDTLTGITESVAARI